MTLSGQGNSKRGPMKMAVLAKHIEAEFKKLPDRFAGNEANFFVKQKAFMRASAAHVRCEFDNYNVDGDPSESQHEQHVEARKEFLRKSVQYAENIKDNIANGRNIIFGGNPGTGKDHMVMAIAKATFDAHLWVARTSGPALRQELGDAMRSGKVTDVIDSLVWNDALWISDPAIDDSGATPFYADILYQIVDAMYCRRRPIWLTVNAASGEVIKEMVGIQSYDRIRDRAMAYHCAWPSYRKVTD